MNVSGGPDKDPFDRLRAALHTAGLRDIASPEPLIARPIAGHSNTVFSISTGGRRYAVRLSHDPAAPGRHPSAAEAALAAWRLGLGPRPVWTSRDGACAIVEWIEGAETLKVARQGADGAHLQKAARALRAFHDSAPPLKRLLEIDAILAPSPSSPEWAPLDKARAAWRLVCETSDGLAPAHGDASPGNILFAQGRVVLIDWEYAAMAPRVFDLAYLAVEAGLPPTEVAARLAGAYGPPVSPTLVRLAMLPVAVMNALWREAAAPEVSSSAMSLTERLSFMPDLIAAAEF